jgi:putative isomerase
MIAICECFKDDPSFDYATRRARVIEAGQGCVKTFLSVQLDDGYIPIVLNEGMMADREWEKVHRKEHILNQHKPFLCQQILQISEYADDYAWFEVEPLVRYIDYYKKEQFHEVTGLYIWRSDFMIGIDNNPTVYAFPFGSTGDLYLNTFMYKELCALVKLLKIKGDNRFAVYEAEAERLKNAVCEECYDCRDEIFYSVFLDLSNRRVEGWHIGMELGLKTLPIRIRHALSFLASYAGIATPEQNARIIERHFKDEKFNSPHGLRSLASDERGYSLQATSNPSNSSGPVWLIYNYIAFYAMLNAGRKDLAEEVCEKMVENFAKDILKNGKTDESYHPETGEPIMGHSFLSWNSLIVDMINQIR